MKKIYVVSILILLAVVGASPAVADPIHVGDTLDLTFPGFPAGVPEGGVGVTRSFNGGSNGAFAALIHFLVAGGGSLDTFCVQIGVHVNTDTTATTTYEAITPVGYSNQAGSPYDTTGPGFDPTGSLSSDELTALERLWANAYGLIDTNIESAAFQLAIWELVYDNAASGAYDLTTGLFQILPSTAAAANAVALANSWLNDAINAPTWTATQSLVILHNDEYQDLLAPTSVPEPMTMLLLGMGLAGVGMIRRRMQA